MILLSIKRKIDLVDQLKRKRILKEGTNKEVLWLYLQEDLELRSNIEIYLDKGYKINAIKCLKAYIEDKPQGESEIYKNSNLREIKDTIDRYSIRYNITKKLEHLRGRIEEWANENGYENIKNQTEVKSEWSEEYVYTYTDWEMVDDHYGLMINDWDWNPVTKQMKLYNTLWRQYK